MTYSTCGFIYCKNCVTKNPSINIILKQSIVIFCVKKRSHEISPHLKQQNFFDFVLLLAYFNDFVLPYENDFLLAMKSLSHF